MVFRVLSFDSPERQLRLFASSRDVTIYLPPKWEQSFDCQFGPLPVRRLDPQSSLISIKFPLEVGFRGLVTRFFSGATVTIIHISGCDSLLPAKFRQFDDCQPGVCISWDFPLRRWMICKVGVISIANLVSRPRFMLPNMELYKLM